MPQHLLVLDDDRRRLAGFEAVFAALGDDWRMTAWRDAPSMISALEGVITSAALISLDHDLYRDQESDPDPGTGRDVANWLAAKPPRCPLIIHSTNTDAAWGMSNELTSAGWNVTLVHHLSQPDWIRDLWLPVARRLVGSA